MTRFFLTHKTRTEMTVIAAVAAAAMAGKNGTAWTGSALAMGCAP